MLTLLLALVATGSSPQVMGLDGRQHHPFVDAGRRPSVLLFISHDCPICNIYTPEIQRIEKKYARSSSFSLVYAEPNFSLASAKKHYKSYAYVGFHAYLDPLGVLSKFVGATITPEAAVYDENGRLAYLGRIDDLYVAFGKQRSHATTHDLRSAIDSVLAHQKVANPRSAPVGCYIATN